MEECVQFLGSADSNHYTRGISDWRLPATTLEVSFHTHSMLIRD
jgi:hypothetical protein